MREIRPSGLEGGGADHRSPYPYPGQRLEVGGVTPELVLRERFGVMQPHHQRGVNLVEKTFLSSALLS